MVKEYKYIDVSSENFSLKDKKVCIWGRSISALALYVELYNKGVDIIGFTDSYVEGQAVFAGLPVFEFKEIQKMDNLVIYISTVNLRFLREILEKTDNLNNAVVLCRRTVYGAWCYDSLKLKSLIEKNVQKIEEVRKSLCDKKSIETFDNLLKYRICNDVGLIRAVYENSHCQYFPEGEFLPKSKNEVFIDAGGYNGETSCKFADWSGNSYSKIYIMEPDKLMCTVAEEYVKIKNLHDVIFINKGAYSGKGVSLFHSDSASGSSCITVNGEKSIQTISIDEMLGGEKATFIKMDIEGVEMEALIGADKTITAYKPKLAISIYHREDDLWEIPYYINKKYPWYKLFMRHYTPITSETVLYAVAE